MDIRVRWADNTAALVANLREGAAQIEVTKSAAERMTASLQGDKLIQAARNMAAAIQGVGGVSTLTASQMERANALFQKAGEKLQATGQGASYAAQTFRDLAKQTESTDAQMARLAGNLQKIGPGLTTIGVGLTAGITAPFVGAVVAGAAFSSAFEATTTKLVSLAGVQKGELAGVKQHILDLAPAVGIGPQALADGMMKISSTVSDTNVALQILDVAARGSAAGLGTVFDVGGAITAVVNSYGAANITAARAADVLTKAVQDGGAEAKELAPLLANVTPIAAQMGVSFEEVAANIATVTKLGVPASEAVTQLVSVMASLLKENGKGAAALATVGTSYAALRAELREKGLVAVVQDLTERFKGNEEQIFKVTGRIEGFRNIMSVSGAQAATYVDELARMKDAAGTLDGAFESMKGTQAQTWAELTALVETIAIRFGDALAPALKKTLEGAKPLLEDVVGLVKWFGDLPEPLRNTVLVMGGLAAALGPAALLAGSLAGNIARLIPLLQTLAGTTAFKFLSGAAGAAAVPAAIGTGLAAGVVARFTTAAGQAGNLAYLPPEFVKEQQAVEAATKALDEHKRTVDVALPSQKALAESVTTTATAHKTLAELVQALTSDEKASIESKRALGETVKTIAKETGLATDVVALYVKQQESATKATEKTAKATEKAASETNASITRTANNWDDYFRAVAKGEGDTVYAQIANIDKWERTQIASLAKTRSINANYENEIASIHQAAAAKITAAIEATYAASTAHMKALTNEGLKGIEDWATGLGKLKDALAKVTTVGLGDNLNVASASRMSAFLNGSTNTTDILKEADPVGLFDMRTATNLFDPVIFNTVGVNAGHAIKEGIKTSLQDVGTVLQRAFEGGGGLTGAIKSIITQIGASVITPLMAKLSDAVKGIVSGGSAIAGAVGGRVDTAGAIIGSTAGAIGGAAVAASIGTAAAASVAGAVAIGAATAGIGLAAVGAYYGLKKVFTESAESKALTEAQEKVIDQLKQIATKSQIAGGALSDGYHAIAIVARDAFLEYGLSAQAAGQYVRDLLDTSRPKQFADAMAALGSVLDYNAQKTKLIEQYTRDGGTAIESVNQAMKDWNLTINDMGPAFKQQNLDELAGKLLQDWKLLGAAGVDNVMLLEHMKGGFQDLADASFKTGTAIPENLKPAFQKLIDLGEITDENGQKLTDVGQLQWTTPLDEKFKTLLGHIDDLVNALTYNLTGAINGLPDKTVHINFVGDSINDLVGRGDTGNSAPPNLDGYGLPAFAAGVQNFAGGLAMVGEHGPEIVNLPRGSDVVPNPSSFNSDLTTRITQSVNIGGNSVRFGTEALEGKFAELADHLKLTQRNQARLTADAIADALILAGVARGRA